MTEEASAVEAVVAAMRAGDGAAAARSCRTPLAHACRYLLRLREAAEKAPTFYHELVQALHLRRSGNLDDDAVASRVLGQPVSPHVRQLVRP